MAWIYKPYYHDKWDISLSIFKPIFVLLCTIAWMYASVVYSIRVCFISIRFNHTYFSEIKEKKRFKFKMKHSNSERYMQFLLVTHTHTFGVSNSAKKIKPLIGMLRNCSKIIVENGEDREIEIEIEGTMRPNRKLFCSSCTAMKLSFLIHI